ncbi:GNAT family N-acetyltransferase [Dongia rigui]|uniref:GNAT family protein n=1 Tax=Dongia rigui TaxID=940149 RepID=A0ABU5DVQ2_9PROT|nr:GNAT family protein [Dongia rigui]MDY0871390.1 GNAT family protein [Dongia rigui]
MFLFEPVYRPQPPVLAGDSIYLRPPLLADYRAWSTLREMSRAFLEPWEPLWGDNALSRGSFRGRISRVVREWNGDLGYSFHIFATGRDNLPRDTLLGGVNLNNVRRLSAQSCNLGYWMGEPYAGLGLMRAALELLLPFAFATPDDDRPGLGLHRIDAACIPGNDRSRRLLRRCGFHEIGLAPSYLKINGTWRDHICHQLLAEDFARFGTPENSSVTRWHG